MGRQERSNDFGASRNGSGHYGTACSRLVKARQSVPEEFRMREIRLSFVLPLLFLAVVLEVPVVLAQPAGTFTATDNLTIPRFFHTATLLPNGKVLIVGGYTDCDRTCRPAETAELYDPASATFTPAGKASAAYVTGTVLLPDGRVLIAGTDITRTVASLETYDRASGT